MTRPLRMDRLAGQYARVDEIPFRLPVASTDTSALMAGFFIDWDKAASLLPGKELHPFRLWKRGILLVTVVDYRQTSIGSYIEYSIAIACTHGRTPAPRLIGALFADAYEMGQFVVDLPVSTEISVKGGKGIWGMPKHQASLDFKAGERFISSQYDLDGQLATYVEIENPGKAWFPMKTAGINYCEFRGMLMKSFIYFQGKSAFKVGKGARGRFVVGDHPRVAPLKTLNIDPNPFFTAFIPFATGSLDDHFEAWFITADQPPQHSSEGLPSVVDLGEGMDWLPAPTAPVPGKGT